jgi:hypothetical protein
MDRVPCRAVLDEEISRSASTTLREISERVCDSALRAIVVQHREGILKRRWKVAWFGWACDARDGAEIFVNGPEVVIRQVAETRPGHGLEKICAEWSRNASRVNDSCWAGRVEVIQVHARPHDLNKFGKRVASYGQSSFIRCQVAGDDVRGAWRYGAKIPAAAKVGRRIDYRRLAKVWVLVRQELSDRRASAVALVAGDVCVDDIAA